MQVISDYFQDTAYRMGYKPEDLLPITREGIEEESQAFTKGMSEKEKDYYINKKMVTLMQRQNKIIGEVQRQIKKKEFSYKFSSDDKSKLHNPVISKLISQHQKIIQKNIKFLDTIHRKKEMDKRRFSITSNNSRKNQDLSNKSSVSNVSRRSNNSSQSSKSNRSAISSASTKEKLFLVRKKQEEKERQMKEIFKQRQVQNSRKSLRAEEEAMKKSQKIRTRSEINKQIVEENKRDLKYMQSAEVRSHFEQLKFKMQKTEQIREKNARRKEQKSSNMDYRQFRRNIQEQSKKILAYRYNDKFKTASMRLQNQEILRNEARNYQKLTQTLKLSNARQNKQQKEKQQKQFLEALHKNEQQRLQTAEIKRYSFQDQKKLRHINQEVKNEIALKNINSINHRRKLQAEALEQKLQQKFDKINQIQIVKKTLDRERNKKIRELSFQNNTMDSKRSKINSFFDI